MPLQVQSRSTHCGAKWRLRSNLTPLPPVFLPSPSAALRQGEILANLVEHRAAVPARDLSIAPIVEVVDVREFAHPWLVVLSADCDLDQDYQVRVPTAEILVRNDFEHRRGRRLMDYILVCPAFLESEVRVRLPPGSAIWDRVKGNQDVRYHRIEAGEIAFGMRVVPELFLDFLRSFTLPADSIYDALESPAVERVAVIPPVYVHALVQRYFAFQSRIGLPEE